MQDKTMKSFKKIFILGAVFILISIIVFGCAPSAEENGPEDSSNDANNTPATVEWTMESDCAACHTAEGKTTSDTSFTASVHAAGGVECATCHYDETGLEKAHEGATVEGAAKATRLMDSTISQDTCLTCHADYKEETSEFPGLVDSKGTVVDPHNVPAVDNHKNITCISCHKQHQAESAEDAANSFCLGCHHENVYECYTCHE